MTGVIEYTTHIQEYQASVQYIVSVILYHKGVGAIRTLL